MEGVIYKADTDIRQTIKVVKLLKDGGLLLSPKSERKKYW
jgi:hypothetical protein